MAQIIRSSLLADCRHGFSTHEGLDAADVLAGAALVRVRQVHSPDVVTITRPDDGGVEGDALVTDTPGLVLGIVTADCAPVLLVDVSARVIGAAHAGWRGAHGGVIENTVAAMESLGAQPGRIVAAIGPTIAGPSYEVDDSFRVRFTAGDERFFATGEPGHFQFDLPAYVAHRLRRSGVGAIDDLALDTYGDPSRFHSFRRSTHRGEDTAGRQISLIALAG